ncbi:hypothetical protein HQO42_14725 [Rhodococcus fascians]|nr:hypothetical protein [Rhodococcus fascians]MBY4237709.1 hypothetical protein [Rhodococcus fascians]MBY4253912.1 hypothetical protein [Rhodococcus fascians]MBY4269217.1 hypothetical protein [Rhodococcus fascians]
MNEKEPNMSDSTVPAEHYMSTVKALVKLINKVDELEGQLRDYEDAFEQLAKDAHNEDNASWWLSDAGIEAVQNSFGADAGGRAYSADEIRAMDEHADSQSREGWAGDVDSPIPYTIAEPAPDFSNTATEEPGTYSLAETAAILGRQGIDTGQNKLKKYLNEGICWTDAYGTPRGIAGDYLIETEPANPSRDAVVRVTPEGVNELERVLNVAV